MRKINVLTIGSSDLKDRFLSVAKEYPEINMNYITYTVEEEVLRLIEKHQMNYDALLFSGARPYEISKMKITKPSIYIKFAGTSLYRVLYHLKNKRNEGKALNISIDGMKMVEVEECFEELDIKVDKLFNNKNSLKQNLDHLINYHEKLWESKKIDVAITATGLVYEQLKLKGVNVERIKPTRLSIRSGIQQLLFEVKHLQYKDLQIAVGIIDLSNAYKDKYLTEYQLQRRILSLQNLLVDYSEQSQALIKWSDRNEVKFITTRGALQFESSGSKEMELLHKIFSKIELKVSLGIGIGQTANEAELHAKEALMHASVNVPSCFVVDTDRTVHGPIGNQLQLTYSMRNNDKEILQIAKQANLSSATINRVVSFCETHGKDTVTSAELAKGLGIAPRSARRILNNLEEVNLAVITGEEQPVHRGRPRQVYSLFPELDFGN